MTAIHVQSATIRLGEHVAVDDVTLSVAPGEFVGLIGPNGAGKTTLMRAMAGVQRLDTGAVLIGGRLITDWPRRALAREIAYLPQGGVAHWPLEARRLVALGRLPHATPFHRGTAADEAAIDKALDDADARSLATRPVNELSGGERALVLMARALAVEAPTLLADEPAAMLDPAHQLQIMELLKSIAGQGRTVVAVLHDLALAARYCARLVMMRHGRIVADGTPQDVLSPAILRQAYGVEGVVVERADGRVVLPWRRIGT